MARRILMVTAPAFAGFVALLLSTITVPASAAAALTVAQAISSQGGTGSVVGYVVGEPTATNTVRFSGFTGDTAIAIADSRTETGTSRMVYVQVTSAYRTSFGLLSNPSLIGEQITVTGSLTAYFSHAGLKSPTAMSGSGATPSPTASSDAYYAAASGKSGDALKNALHTIISTNVTTISYDAVWNALKVTDQDPSNAANVVLLYSGISRSKTLNGGNSGNWNREHVWAQSHGDFGTGNGPGTDLHHLRPEDVTINATRGNKDFDTGGSAVSGASGNYTDADSWEPRNAVKGDVARMIFYMAVRYEGGDGFADLEVNNSVSNGSHPYLGKLSTLLTWNSQDPPDAAERNRNQVIYSSYQHNRNPFIDHPEWVNSIFG
ncbi:endonuclease [Actinoplanes sp. NPDC023714]|uniref:endonuclease n=1 Tax=Actinoplanes sp. NPDC023714 TaxID=3154322 RepID=UPI0033C5CE9F